MTDKMFIEIDKEDLISLIIRVDADNYDSRFVNSLPLNLEKYGMWFSDGGEVYWFWMKCDLEKATFEELVEIYKLVKTLK